MSATVADHSFLSDRQTAALVDGDAATAAGMGDVPQALTHVGLSVAADRLRADRAPVAAASGGARARG